MRIADRGIRAKRGTNNMDKLNAEKMVRSCYENFPEASYGSSLECVGWHYAKFIFNFIDHETGKKYRVTLPQAIKGFKKFVAMVRAGELPGLGLAADFETSEDSWDGPCYDALAQCAILGEVIYG